MNAPKQNSPRLSWVGKFNIHRIHMSKSISVFNLAILLLLPKCSLCLFTLSSAIAVCGLEMNQPPIWEYLVVCSFSLIPLLTLRCRCWKKGMPRVILILCGIGSIQLFAFFDSAGPYVYYMGVILLTLSAFQNLYKKWKDYFLRWMNPITSI